MRGATHVAVVDGVEIEGDWPRPLVPPDRPSDAARAVEAARAERATARGAALRASDLPLAHVDPRGGFVVVNKPSGVYVDDVHRALRDARGVGASASSRTGSTGTRPGAWWWRRGGRERILARAFREGRVVKDYLAHCCTVGVPLPDARADARDTDADDAARERGSPFERVMTGAAVTVRTGHGRGAAGLWRLSDVARRHRTLPGRTGGARSPNRVKEAVTVLRRADDRRVPIGDDARAARVVVRARRRRDERITFDCTARASDFRSSATRNTAGGSTTTPRATMDSDYTRVWVRFRTAEGEGGGGCRGRPGVVARSGGGDGVEIRRRRREVGETDGEWTGERWVRSSETRVRETRGMVGDVAR